MDGTRNLLYKGKYSNTNRLRVSAFLPQASNALMAKAAMAQSRAGPRTTNSPNTNKKKTTAPT